MDPAKIAQMVDVLCGPRQGLSLLLVLLFGVDQLDSPGCGSVTSPCGRQPLCRS